MGEWYGAKATCTIVTLSLRGTRFDVPADYADALPANSFLRRVLAGTVDVPRDSVGARFIPRNPTHFHTILDVVADPSYAPRLDSEWQRRSLARELVFWGVPCDPALLEHGEDARRRSENAQQAPRAQPKP
uniref:Potassium channel tetramerisation-type BTB domain-containing protein n=1 Tax=Neobodo designis TaxID=312471 RepID=A0A7S1R3M4_NEODS|mmetsp:Transcript_765/g.2653  ORF Transcript_765/g.2653 Transcript_765/m.2653 type:complete len:131 (+) Transcript_765:32-424(+)